MKIIIGCSSNQKIGSKLIQWWMNADYSHVYARWDLATQQRTIVFQASHGMVHEVEFNNFKSQNKIVKEFTLDLPDSLFVSFSQNAIDLLEQKYSIVELIQIFISDLTKGKIKFSDQSGYICSELMAELLELFFDAKFDKPRYLIRPDDIINFLEKNHGKI